MLQYIDWENYVKQMNKIKYNNALLCSNNPNNLGSEHKSS